MLTIEYVENLAYIDADAVGIEILVKFKELPEAVPFHAMPNDPEPHGRLLYDNAKAGIYGEIGIFVEGGSGGN